MTAAAAFALLSLYAVRPTAAQVFPALLSADAGQVGTGARIAGEAASDEPSVAWPARPLSTAADARLRFGYTTDYAATWQAAGVRALRYRASGQSVELTSRAGGHWTVAVRVGDSSLDLTQGHTAGSPDKLAGSSSTVALSAGRTFGSGWSAGLSLGLSRADGRVRYGDVSLTLSGQPRTWTAQVHRSHAERDRGVRVSGILSAGSATGSALGLRLQSPARLALTNVTAYTFEGSPSDRRGLLLLYSGGTLLGTDIVDVAGFYHGFITPRTSSLGVVASRTTVAGQSERHVEFGVGWLALRADADIVLLPMPELFGGRYTGRARLSGPAMHAAVGFTRHLTPRFAASAGLRADIAWPRGSVRCVEVGTVLRPSRTVFDATYVGRPGHAVTPTLGLSYRRGALSVAYAAGWPIVAGPAAVRPPAPPGPPAPRVEKLPSLHALTVSYEF